MNPRNSAAPLSTNRHLLRWIEKMAALTTPAAIHWVDGSQQEYDALCAGLVSAGTFTQLNENLWPGCFLARSDPDDVARVGMLLAIIARADDHAKAAAAEKGIVNAL
jgi:phosphoenolpyruvate carboxykinase (GTP)